MINSQLLSVEDLHLDIVERGIRMHVLRNINLHIGHGQVHGLVGESGGGKTMVGKAILGILPVTAEVTGGTIRFAGELLMDRDRKSNNGLLGKKISMILQDPMTALNPVLRIETQIIDVLRKHLRLSRFNAHKKALELLEAVEIREPERVLRQFPHELSGGMRQRVIISIAFACDPELVIADEPTTALDVTVQKQILQLIKEQQSRTGAAVLFITHDLGVVSKICDDVSVIYGGRILETSSVKEIFTSPKHDYTRALFAATPRYDQPTAQHHPVPEELAARLSIEGRLYDAERNNA